MVRNMRMVGTDFICGCEFEEEQGEAIHGIHFYVMTTIERIRGETPEAPRILVIEQNEGTASILCKSLEDQGYEASFTSDAMDGFFLLRMSFPGALLVNYSHPGMSGFEICRTVKSSSRFENLPILIYGGKSDELAKATIEAGAAGYIPSIKNFVDVLKALEQHLPVPPERVMESEGSAEEQSEA